MNNFLEKLKGMPKSSIPVYVEIYKILKANDKNSITSYDIFESMDSNLREGLTPAKITQRLETLKKRRVIEKANQKITYIMDVMNDKPVYGLYIGKKFFDYLSELLIDASNNERILEIVFSNLESTVKSSDNDQKTKDELLLEINTIKTDKTKISEVTNYIISCTGDSSKGIFKLYNSIFSDIVEQGLYDENKNYGELKRQNTANKYRLL